MSIVTRVCCVVWEVYLSWAWRDSSSVLEQDDIYQMTEVPL